MSDKYKKLVELLRKVTEVRYMPLINATVTDITGDTCTVMYGDLELTDVRLKATVDEDGTTLLLEPKIGSFVTLGSFTGDFRDLTVLRADALQKVVANIDGDIDVKAKRVSVDADEVQVKSKKVSIDADSTVFNGGGNNGVPKVDFVSAKLNEVINDVNNLKSIFGSWTPVAMDGGLALKGVVTPWVSSTLGTTSTAELQNDKFKH